MFLSTKLSRIFSRSVALCYTYLNISEENYEQGQQTNRGIQIPKIHRFFPDASSPLVATEQKTAEQRSLYFPLHETHRPPRYEDLMGTSDFAEDRFGGDSVGAPVGIPGRDIEGHVEIPVGKLVETVPLEHLQGSLGMFDHIINSFGLRYLRRGESVYGSIHVDDTNKTMLMKNMAIYAKPVPELSQTEIDEWMSNYEIRRTTLESDPETIYAEQQQKMRAWQNEDINSYQLPRYDFDLLLGFPHLTEIISTGVSGDELQRAYAKRIAALQNGYATLDTLGYVGLPRELIRDPETILDIPSSERRRQGSKFGNNDFLIPKLHDLTRIYQLSHHFNILLAEAHPSIYDYLPSENTRFVVMGKPKALA